MGFYPGSDVTETKNPRQSPYSMHKHCIRQSKNSNTDIENRQCHQNLSSATYCIVFGEANKERVGTVYICT